MCDLSVTLLSHEDREDRVVLEPEKRQVVDEVEYELCGLTKARVLGLLGEELFRQWLLNDDHVLRLVKRFIDEDDFVNRRFSVDFVKPNTNGTQSVKVVGQKVLEPLRCDFLLKVNTPQGKVGVMVEVKTGASVIQEGQYQYYRDVVEHPSDHVEKAKENHVIVARVKNLELVNEAGQVDFEFEEIQF